MSELTIFGTVDYVPGKHEELLAALAAHRARCLADEPGTLQFEILMPRDLEGRVFMYEVYSDEAAFRAHLAGASFARVSEETADVITNLSTDQIVSFDR